jgi:hypothetical protein
MGRGFAVMIRLNLDDHSSGTVEEECRSNQLPRHLVNAPIEE